MRIFGLYITKAFEYDLEIRGYEKAQSEKRVNLEIAQEEISRLNALRLLDGKKISELTALNEQIRADLARAQINDQRDEKGRFCGNKFIQGGQNND